jgi:ribose/xylose/arabinose/galactoside ABC-type transport system permease subunit
MPQARCSWQNAMNLKGVDPFCQYVASGSILLAAVVFDQLKSKFNG